MKNRKYIVVFLVGMMVIGKVTYGQQSTTLTIVPKKAPGSFVSCTNVLKHYESASLTINVAPPPEGYVEKWHTDTISSSHPEFFIWSGGYWVMNTAGTSATTVVTVKYYWEWEGTEGPGGGGEGPEPPDLLGTAQGTASARPAGKYWNKADKHVEAVGVPVLVHAYTNDSDPAPSSWSVEGPASIQGAGANATLTGTSPSDEEYDVIVTSICNTTGQSDDERLTIVGVASITGTPSVVCVSGSVDYTIATQPTGHEYMVSWAPADTRTPGIKEVIATCGTSAATCTVTVVEVDLDNTAEEDFFRSTSDAMHFTVTPSSFADALDISLAGFDSEHWNASYDSSGKKIDLVNLIETSEPMAWLDNQLLSVSATITGVAGEWDWTKTLDLKKRLDGIREPIMDSLATTLAEEFATLPGQYAGELVSDQMSEQFAYDSNGIKRYFSEVRIGEVADVVKDNINNAWSDFTGTTLPGDICSQDLHDQVTDESWTWTWETELTIDVTGGSISVDQGGNPHLNPGDWIKAVNNYGWTEKLFDPQKLSLTASLTGDGHVGHALFKAKMFGEVSCSFDGYYDSETQDWTNGGQFSGMIVGLLLKCWF